MKLLLAALAVIVLLAFLGTIGGDPDACAVAENWRQPGVCD